MCRFFAYFDSNDSSKISRGSSSGLKNIASLTFDQVERLSGNRPSLKVWMPGLSAKDCSVVSPFEK